MKKRLFLLFISTPLLFLNADMIKTLPIDNTKLKQYINKAQHTLSYFLEAHKNTKYKNANFLLKSKIIGDNENMEIIHLWFGFIKYDGKYFYVKSFEIPDGYSNYKNKIIKLEKKDIEDWWLEDNGKLYGAYTVVMQRGKLKTQKEKNALDDYMGISQYMTSMP